METKRTRRRDFLGKLGLAGAGALALFGGKGAARADDDRQNQDGNALTGLWDVTVIGQATYYYTYSFSREALVAVGNIDNNWDGQGSSFGATMGSWARQGGRSFAIREKGWAFDPQGNPAGYFTFAGTYTADKTYSSLTGEGTYRLFDTKGQEVFTEALTISGKRVG